MKKFFWGNNCKKMTTFAQVCFCFSLTNFHATSGEAVVASSHKVPLCSEPEVVNLLCLNHILCKRVQKIQGYFKRFKSNSTFLGSQALCSDALVQTLNKWSNWDLRKKCQLKDSLKNSFLASKKKA